MEWLNQGVGLIALISGIVSFVLLFVTIMLLVNLRNRIAVQRLKMHGSFTTDTDSRENYAQLVVGNRSINEVGVAEIGIKNGGVCFPLTDLYRRKTEIMDSSRIVIEQRKSITFRMTEEELETVLVETPRGRRLRTLRLYVVDYTGNVYKGKIRPVRKLLREYLARVKREAKLAAKGLLPAPSEEPPILPPAGGTDFSETAPVPETPVFTAAPAEPVPEAAAPAEPFVPAEPFAAPTPVEPVAPVEPAVPFAPVAPVEPVAPFAPVEPAAPSAAERPAPSGALFVDLPFDDGSVSDDVPAFELPPERRMFSVPTEPAPQTPHSAEEGEKKE